MVKRSGKKGSPTQVESNMSVTKARSLSGSASFIDTASGHTSEPQAISVSHPSWDSGNMSGRPKVTIKRPDALGGWQVVDGSLDVPIMSTDDRASSPSVLTRIFLRTVLWTLIHSHQPRAFYRAVVCVTGKRFIGTFSIALGRPLSQ